MRLRICQLSFFEVFIVEGMFHKKSCLLNVYFNLERPISILRRVFCVTLCFTIIHSIIVTLTICLNFAVA